jgi:hypothetical protein
MPQADDISSASLGLAVGLGLIALFLGLREWYERKAREPDLSPADHRHYLHQDLRRRVGVGVLLTIAILALAGSRVQPDAFGRANLSFVALWFVVLALIAVLLGLALADLLATGAFERRRRKEMLRESIEAIRRDARQAAARPPQKSKGPGDSSPPDTRE